MACETPQRSDEELVREALAGESAAFGALVQRHFGAVFAVALARLRDFDAAEDLTQEVFLRAQIHLRQLGIADRFPAWVTRIARNLAIDWQRRGQSASRLLPMVPLGPMTEHVPDPTDKGAREAMLAQETSGAVRDAILNLPAELREVVLLQVAEDLTQEEIAERLGIHQATVSRRLQRALDALRGTLRPLLREAAPALRPSPRALARSLMIATAVGAMSATAKASLAAAAPAGQIQQATAAVQAGAVGAIGILGFFQSLPALLSGGVQMLGTAKGMTVAGGAAVAAIAGGTYLYTESQTPEVSEHPLGMEMIALPGGSFEMGLSDEEVKTLARALHLRPDQPDREVLEPWIDRGLPWEEMARAMNAMEEPPQALLDLIAFAQNRPERPPHRVTLDPFHIGATEVTVDQYFQFITATGHPAPEQNIRKPFAQNPQTPITNVSWDDAMAFCAWMTENNPGTYTLPTEAEWEHACRAGTRTLFAFGDTLEPDEAHFSHEIHGAGPLDVGSFPANAWGLHDMHGNVSEWCLDLFREDFYERPTATRRNPVNEEPRPAGPSHVTRGGGWVDVSRFQPGGLLCRSSFRGPGFTPDFAADDLGFRVVWFDAEPGELRGADLVQAAFAGARVGRRTPTVAPDAEFTQRVMAVTPDGRRIELPAFSFEQLEAMEDREQSGEERAALLRELGLPTIPRDARLVIRHPEATVLSVYPLPDDIAELGFDIHQMVLETGGQPSLGIVSRHLPDTMADWEVGFTEPVIGDILGIFWESPRGEGTGWLAWFEGSSPAEAPAPTSPGAHARGLNGEWIALREVQPDEIRRIWERAQQGEDVEAIFSEMNLPTVPPTRELVVVAPDLEVTWDETFQAGGFRLSDMQPQRLEASGERIAGIEGGWRVTLEAPPEGDAFTLGWVHITEGPQRMWMARLAGDSEPVPLGPFADAEDTARALVDALRRGDWEAAQVNFFDRESLAEMSRRIGQPMIPEDDLDELLAQQRRTFEETSAALRAAREVEFVGLGDLHRGSFNMPAGFDRGEDVRIAIRADGEERTLFFNLMLKMDDEWRLLDAPVLR